MLLGFSQNLKLNLNLSLGAHSATRLDKKKTRPNLTSPAGSGRDWGTQRQVPVPLVERKSLGKYIFNYAKWLSNGAVWLIVIVFLMNELPFLKESE